ncbi:hypothetical protein ACFVX9_04090 [Kitasatospora sp. NPDC058243]|uniref:hypothetical protein n=1 Tax=Kitasatospora sp. NPDC058243 TaxID=3346397 RepID=UPI0036D9C4F2
MTVRACLVAPVLALGELTEPVAPADQQGDHYDTVAVGALGERGGRRAAGC